VQQPKQTQVTEDDKDAKEKDEEFVGTKHVDGGGCKECCCVTLKMIKMCSNVSKLLGACL